jgi:hypothetical protein
MTSDVYNYAGARDKCAEEGGTLASVHNQDENNAYQSNLVIRKR